MQCAICCFKTYQGMFFDCMMGKCPSCPNSTDCHEYQLCDACSVSKEKCYLCGNDVVMDVTNTITQLDRLKYKYIQDHRDMINHLKQSKYLVYNESDWTNDPYYNNLDQYYHKVVKNLMEGNFKFM